MRFLKQTFRWAAVLTATALFLFAPIILSGAGVSYAQESRDLFQPATAAGLKDMPEKKKTKHEPTVVRSRLVTIDLGLVMDDSLPKGDETITLNLFDDVNFIAVKDRLQVNSPTQHVWYGRVKGVSGSQIIMVVDKGQMAGNINLLGIKYQIRPVDGGVHSVREIDPSRFPSELPPVPVKLPGTSFLDNGRMALDGECTADNRRTLNNTADTVADFRGVGDGSVIAVLVVYTKDAADTSGNIAAEIALAIAETNQAYGNSGISQRLTLVGSGQVDYTESGSLATDLTALKGNADGEMDIIHTWRDDNNADCVLLIVETGGACGVAYHMNTVRQDFEAWAFAVNRRDCATGYYSFGHELGHIMSARHDCYDDDGLTPYEYCHGYVDPANGWRTIMAYNDECEDLYGINCTRIQYFSNPDLTYNGAPLGTTTVTTTTTTTTTTTQPAGGDGGGGGGGCFISALFSPF